MNKNGNSNSLKMFELIKEDIKCVFQRDPAARSTFDVLATYPGVHAIIVHRLSNKAWNKGWQTISRLLSFFIRTVSNIDIHPGASIGRRFFIDHGAGVVIGETAIIGDDVTLYHGVTLGGTSWNKGKRHPTLGNGVMVGAGAKVLGPITISENARVGANSVVVTDIPAHRTVVGVPGKIVQLKEAGELNPFGIDLNHHLIPDPVGRAISCLVDRITILEDKLAKANVVNSQKLDEDCVECEANDVCETEQSNEAALLTMKKVSGG